MEARPTAVILGNATPLALSIARELLNKSCKVIAITHEVNPWLVIQNKYLQVQALDAPLPESASYGFLISDLNNTSKFTEPELEKVFQYFVDKNTKTAVILPYLITSGNRDEAGLIVNAINKFKSPKILVFYLGEVIGPNMEAGIGYVSRTIIAASRQKTLRIPEYDFEIFPLYLEDGVTEIIKNIFSFGTGNKQTVIASRITVSNFLALVQKAKPSLEFIKDKNFTVPPVVRANSNNFARIPALTPQKLSVTIHGLASNFEVRKITPPVQPVTSPKPKPIPKPKAKVKRQYKLPNTKLKTKYVIASVLILLWILMTPFLALFVSGLTLKKSFSDISSGKTQNIKTLLTISKKSNEVARFGFSAFAKVPLLGSGFKFFIDTSRIIAEANDIGEKGLLAESVGRDIATGILGSSDYDITGLSGEMSLTLTDLYDELSLFQTEIDAYPTSILRIIPESVNIKEIRATVDAARNISSSLPKLLGATKSQTYMVLFQNNMELRPTGGFIGSFGLFTFDKGRLIDNSIFDVYEADGQLRGHVEPPATIKNYLGEANWYLRDSNWDPDFPSSATKAEWFLGKELDRPVDGVVGMDLAVVKSLLSLTGPVKLTDFNNMEINEKNMYEKIQYEVQNNFFPGSQKKKNLLTSLSNAISEKLTDAKAGSDYIKFGKEIFNNLNQKDIIVFLHDKAAQMAVTKSNWDGAVTTPNCTGNCQDIWLGMVDANVGVDKANYFIKRSANLTVNIQSDKITETLDITYQNNAPASLGLNGNYKNYLRILTPINAGFSQQLDLVDIAGHKEAGSLVEVPAGNIKKVSYSWSIPTSADFNKKGTLYINWRKQPGTGPDPINIKVTTNVPALTRLHIPGYNTNLSSDFREDINW